MDSETINNLLNDEPTTTPTTAPKESKADSVNAEDIDKKRGELTKAAEDGEIQQSARHIKKASAKVVEKLYAELESLRLERANCFLTDLLLSKYADFLGGLDAIESSEELTKELQNDVLLKRDVIALGRYITPFLPFLGFLSGGATTLKHVSKKYVNSTVVVEGEPTTSKEE